MNAADRRAELEERLRAALDAIESNDNDGIRAQLEAITSWRELPLLQHVARLSRELGQALGDLPSTDAIRELPDACARLDAVIQMTEQASHRTLDLVDAARDALRGIQAADPAQEAALQAVRTQLSEVALAQSYQDLTGQTLKKVAAAIRRVHDTLTEMGLPPTTAAAAPRPADDPLTPAGPSLAGIDRPAASQSDADDLLADLGL
jgi:chemotaxis protein CheZ